MRDSIKVVATDTAKRDDMVAPVRPVRTLGKVAVIDTLATESEHISIVLLNDNTWRYVLSEEYKRDSEVFSDHWDTSATHAYKDVELNSLPEAIPIALVDSLEGYHYP